MNFCLDIRAQTTNFKVIPDCYKISSSPLKWVKYIKTYIFMEINFSWKLSPIYNGLRRKLSKLRKKPEETHFTLSPVNAWRAKINYWIENLPPYFVVVQKDIKNKDLSYMSRYGRIDFWTFAQACNPTRSV